MSHYSPSQTSDTGIPQFLLSEELRSRFIQLSQDRENSEQFRSRVNSLIREHEYWKDLFKTLKLDQTIEREVKSQLADAKSVIMGLKNEVRDDVIRNLPGQVAKQIADQLPVFVNQNHQMVEILNKHKERVAELLTAEVNRIVNQIVNDPAYHTVNHAYFDAFNQKGTAEINAFLARSNTVEHDLRQKVDTTIASLTKELQNAAGLKTEIKSLKKTIDNQATYQTVSTIIIAGLIGAIGYLFVKSK